MRIYCILSKLPYISADSGDRINELNVYRALSINHEVFYNNRKIDFSDTKYFGTNPSDRVRFPDKEYDMYYVRNNKNLFMLLPHPKIYFCVPNHQKCALVADAIAFPTKVWRDKAPTRNANYFRNIYNDDDYLPEHLLDFSQVTYPEDLKDHPKTKEYRKMYGGGFIIGHFGRVVKSNMPTAIKYISNKLKANIIFAGGIKASSRGIKLVPRVPYDEVKYAISACDLLLYNQNLQGHFAGSLKIIDAMSYGVPIITPKYEARIHELGLEYPLFVDHQNGRIVPKSLKAVIEKYMHMESLRGYMFKRAEYFNLENSAKYYNDQICRLL